MNDDFLKLPDSQLSTPALINRKVIDPQDNVSFHRTLTEIHELRTATTLLADFPREEEID